MFELNGLYSTSFTAADMILLSQLPEQLAINVFHSLHVIDNFRRDCKIETWKT